jgi:hypothetical protein
VGIEMMELPAHRPEDFDHVFTNKLNDKGRSPFVLRPENACEMSFATESVVIFIRQSSSSRCRAVRFVASMSAGAW